MGMSLILGLFAICQVVGAMCLPSSLPSLTDTSLSTPLVMHCPMPAGSLCQPTFSPTKEREVKPASLAAPDPVAHHAGHLTSVWDGWTGREHGPPRDSGSTPLPGFHVGAPTVLRI